MRILFVSTLSYTPQYYCGANITIHQQALQFLARGHHVSVLVALRPGGQFALASRVKALINNKLYGCKVSRDSGLGYSVWRAWFPAKVLQYVVKQEHPDIIVVKAGEIVTLALAAKKTGVPVCMGLTDTEFQLHGGDFSQLGNIPCIANSNFTARVYSEKFGVSCEVVYPFVQPDKYYTETSRENVTFINPRPEKGSSIALKIARQCPEIPFAFYKTWVLSAEQEKGLAEQIESLPNVTLFNAQDDMKTVYKRCKILLAPSTWEETYGRVATEAQISGIPVVASNRGGLPESVGPGGIILDPNSPIENWVNAIRELWNNNELYEKLSKAAIAHANRPNIDINYQVDVFEKALKRFSKVSETPSD